jgi:hypothetical protein
MTALEHRSAPNGSIHGQSVFLPPYIVHRNSNMIAEISLSLSPQNASSESGARFPHDAKASMSYKTCRSLGLGFWSLRKRGNQHSEISQTWVCTNPVCAHYSYLPSKYKNGKKGNGQVENVSHALKPAW